MGIFGHAAGENDDANRSGYNRKKRDAADRSKAQSASGRDIGEIPAVADSKRREACRLDLQRALVTYFPNRFELAFSPDHIEFIGATERAILEGLKEARAMPRGSGKTTIFECAITWAAIYAHCLMAMLLAATEGKAQDNLASIAAELETNDLLLADFPEICYPIRQLERITQRAKGQTHNGQATRIAFTKDRIVLPTIEGSPASGSIILAKGLTGGGVRGAKHILPDGHIIRPSIVLIDDPQTRKSAASATESRTRELIINGDVMGMAGPGKTLSALCAVTVIYRGDLADRLLNRTLNPSWRGKRCRLMNSMPTNMELWDQYAEIRANEMRALGDGSKANAFYINNRAALDEGADPAWPERKLPSEISAIQHAMNLYYDSREAFHAEYQNEPLDESPDGGELLTAAQIMQRVSSVERAIVPIDTDWLTGHIDVHDRLLYWAIGAWSRAFRGFLIDYGTWPEQPIPYFSMRDCRNTLGEKYVGATKEGAITKGLMDLVDFLCSREWTRESGDEAVFISRLLIDEGYKSKIVQQVCRRSDHRRVLRPAKGWAIKATNVSMAEWKERPGERVGENWRDSPVEGAGIRRVVFDPNFWKSFTHRRLAAAEGDPSSLTLFGSRPKQHELLADHLCAEFREAVQGRGRWVDEWKQRPGRPDNHFLDCVVGSAVAASHLGSKLPDVKPAGKARTTRRRRRRGIRYSG